MSLNHETYEPSRNPLSLDMGWKVVVNNAVFDDSSSRNPLSLDMGWKADINDRKEEVLSSRNPLSLDMGWKAVDTLAIQPKIWSQSAFAGYGLESKNGKKRSSICIGRNPLSLDMGWKVSRL